jgi:hypothetical protein
MEICWRGRFAFAVMVSLLLCSTAVPLLAQATTGAVAQISGTVSDPSGALVPGAHVKATQTNTGFSRAAVTGPDGAYVLPDLTLGPYELQVTGGASKLTSNEGLIFR